MFINFAEFNGVFFVPKDKKIDFVKYTDGTSDIQLDIDDDNMKMLFKFAVENDCKSIDDAVNLILKNYMKYLEQKKFNNEKIDIVD